MDACQPAGLPRPQRAGRGHHTPGCAGRRTQPRTVLVRGRHPARPAGHALHDRHGRSLTSVAAQARQLRLHPKAGDGQATVDRAAVRHADRRRVRTRRVRLRARHRRTAADGGNRRHARGAARGARHAAQVVRRPGVRAELARRRADRQAADGHLRGLHRVHDGRHRQAPRRAHRRPVLGPGPRRGRGRADVRRRDRHGDAADPHRRRRDHPSHTFRWHRTASAPS